VYGLSKLAGEYLIRGLCPRHLILRTCGLYGWRGEGGKGNFVDTMLRLARERGAVRVVADQVCTPTSAADLAEAGARVIGEGRGGCFRGTRGGGVSGQGSAGAIWGGGGRRGVPEPTPPAEYAAAARRPAYSVLASELPPMRPWREALADYLRRPGQGKTA